MAAVQLEDMIRDYVPTPQAPEPAEAALIAIAAERDRNHALCVDAQSIAAGKILDYPHRADKLQHAITALTEAHGYAKARDALTYAFKVAFIKTYGAQRFKAFAIAAHEQGISFQ